MLVDLYEAHSILYSGGVVAIPTDTVYGIAALAFDQNAINKIYNIKKRSLVKKLPLLVNTYDCFLSLVEHDTYVLRNLCSKFWPGRVTLVCKAKELLRHIAAEDGSCAFRMPNSKTCINVIDKVGLLVATSANISGQNSALTANDVFEQFGVNFPVVESTEEEMSMQESTVLYISGDNNIKVVRHGSVSCEEVYMINNELGIKTEKCPICS